LLYFVKILDGLDFLVSLLPVFGFPSARETLLLLVGQARKTPIDWDLWLARREIARCAIAPLSPGEERKFD
jgi:hypothetical protein